MRVALVGLGEIGTGAHLPALLRNDAVELAALVDVAPERRRRAVDLVGRPVPAVASLADVPADVPAVVLATPPWVTPDLAIEALRRDLFVLAEKPVATSVAAARVYDALDEAARRRLQIGLTYRHDPAMRALRENLGELGAPLLIRAHVYDERRDPADPDHQHRIEATLRHGPPVVHEGAHVFDWLSYLLGGGPVSVADTWALSTGYPQPNLIGARLTYPGGATALVEFGWLTDALPRCEISVLGPRGHALLDGVTFRLELTTAAGTTVIDPPGDRVERCFDRQVQRFVDLAIGRTDRPEPNLDDGLAALAVAERVAKDAA